MIKPLGEGASCKVKLAVDTKSGTKVALKLMNDIKDPEIHTLLMTEISTMAKLQHPNVIRQYEYGSADYYRDDGSVKRKAEYIVLEIAKGGELFDYIVSHQRLHEKAAFRVDIRWYGCHFAALARREPLSLCLGSPNTLRGWRGLPVLG